MRSYKFKPYTSEITGLVYPLVFSVFEVVDHNERFLFSLSVLGFTNDKLIEALTKRDVPLEDAKTLATKMLMLE